MFFFVLIFLSLVLPQFLSVASRHHGRRDLRLFLCHFGKYVYAIYTRIHICYIGLRWSYTLTVLPYKKLFPTSSPFPPPAMSYKTYFKHVHNNVKRIIVSLLFFFQYLFPHYNSAFYLRRVWPGICRHHRRSTQRGKNIT